MTVNKNVSKSIAIGGVMTAATLVAAFIFTRRRLLAKSAENLFDACESALQRIGSEGSDAIPA